MSESSKVNSVEKKGGFKALKNEFKKIMWPDKKSIINKTIAVILTTIGLATLIALIDFLISTGLTMLG